MSALLAVLVSLAMAAAAASRPSAAFSVTPVSRARLVVAFDNGRPLGPVGLSHHERASIVRWLSQEDRNADATSTGGQNKKFKEKGSTRERIKSRVKSLAKTLAPPEAIPSPRAVAEIIQDSAVGAVELAVEEVLEELTKAARVHRGRAFGGGGVAKGRALGLLADTAERSAAVEGEAAAALDAVALAKTSAADAFAAAEDAIAEAEAALGGARAALLEAKAEAAEAISAAEEAAALASAFASKATVLATSAAVDVVETAAAATTTTAASATATKSTTTAAAAVESPAVEKTSATTVAAPAPEALPAVGGKQADVASLGYDDVDYHLSEMAPPFIGEDQCLVPGEAIVRVEKAPDNSRRIFAGIDIMASVDDVWKVLTKYDKLQEVVPNLVVNEVLELYDQSGTAPSNAYDPSQSDEKQCQELSKTLRGAKLRQVGGAKVVGINFSARTTLEIREWPEGMPDFAHFSDAVYEGKSRDRRAREGKGLKLKRYRFPRPFALSSLPTRDISMQNVEKDDGEFRYYQGVWRMQPLPGCAPEGEHAMRLTYAVEISPRPYLPVALVEGRIAQDLCTNLRAIRDHVS